MRIIALLFISTLFLASCKKNESETIEQKLQKDATYNNTITPGVGNVLYEKKLVPNSSSQLVFKIAYNEDTLAGYGKINNAGQLQFINSTVLSKKGKAELLVTELFPQVSKSRIYSMLNNVKSKIVLEVNHYSKTKLTISILDMNWATGNSKGLKTTYFVDYKATSNFSAFRMMEGGDKVYNCLEPEPTSDFEKHLDDVLNYFVCGGLAFDTYPILQGVKKLFSEYVESVNQNPQYVNEKSDLESLQNNYSLMNDIYSKIKGRVGEYKYEKQELEGALKILEKTINELKAQQKVEVLLGPFPSQTDVDFDEITDKFITIGLIVKEKLTGLPYSARPIFVEMSFTIPSTSAVVHSEIKPTDPNNGLVIFVFDPTTIPGYENLTSLKATYSMTDDLGTPNAVQNITLKFIKPKVVFANGSSLPSTVKFSKGQSQSFKLVNEDNRVINVNYKDVTLNKSNDKVGYTMLQGTSDFSLSLTTNETTEQLTQLDVIYKQKENCNNKCFCK